MSKIINPEELEFLQQQWQNKSTSTEKANTGDVRITDPIELSELRDDPTAKEDWLNDVMMGSRALVDGYMWGWSDEVAASIAAGVYQTFLKPEESNVQVPQEILERFGEEIPQEASYADVRRMMIGELEKERAQFASDNPILSIGLTVAGGFGSGSAIYNAVKTSIKGTTAALGSAALAVPKVQPLVRSAQQARLQSSLGKAAATPSPATALQASIAADGVAAASAGRTALTATATELPTLAATGALASAGFASQDTDLAEAATEGALWSTFLGGPLTGIINYGLNGATRNRIAQQLGKGRDFIPLGMAALKNSKDKIEKSLEYGFNKIVRHAFGADSLIAQQQKRWTTLADQELARTENTISNTIKDANRRLAATKKDEKSLLKEAVSAVKDQKNLTVGERKLAIEEVKNNLKVNAVADADAATSAAEAALRVQAHKNAVPSGASKKEVEELFTISNMHERQKALNNLWSEYGFKMLKNKKFRVNPAEVASKVKAALGAEREVLAKLSGQKPVNAAEVIDEYVSTYVTKGNWIEGKTLNNLRTTVAEMANKLGTEGADASNKIVLRELVRVLDDVVYPQLSKVNQTAFNNQKKAWGQNIVSRDAITAATRKDGMYTPAEYLGSIKNNNARAAQEGTGFLQKEANIVIQQSKASDEAIKKLAAGQVVKQARQGQAEVTKDLNAAERRIDALKAQADSKIINAESRAEAIKKLETENIRLENLKITRKGYSELAAKTDASPFFKLFSTALLGFGNPIQGLAVGTALGTQGVQRALVGQTQWQTQLNKALQSADQPVAKTVQVLGSARESVASSNGIDLDSSTALNTLNNASLTKQLQAYDKIKKGGNLERLKVANPKVYRTLERANATR